ncbi:hypothetical protein V8C34DRAFT_292287 [Trichoderma compactum]
MLPAQRPCTCSNRPSVEPRVKLAPLLRLVFFLFAFLLPQSIALSRPFIGTSQCSCSLLASAHLLHQLHLRLARPSDPASSCHCARRPSGFLRHQPRIMSDGIAPAVDKVGPPVPTAPEAQAGAPTLAMDTDTAKPEASVNLPTSLEKPKEPPIIAETKAPEEAKPPMEEPLSITDAFKLAHKTPRPVEVQSVPETPVNLATPVNGSPRPELNIPTEPQEPEKPQEEPVIITAAEEPLPTPTASAPGSDVGPDSIVDKPVTPNGESKPAELMAGALQTSAADAKSETSETATGEKRKADATAADQPAAEKEESEDSEPADKKAKIGNGNGKATNGGPRKPGRPKKDKKAAPVVGKTLRKTRSQGPVEI